MTRAARPFPGFAGPLHALAPFTVTGQDPLGEPIMLHTSDYLARCMQHEIGAIVKTCG
jgi:peptide deformylase